MKVFRVLFMMGAALFLTSPSHSQYSWKVLPNAPEKSNGRHEDIFFVNASRGWLVNLGDGEIYRTVDGGQTWDLQFRRASVGFRSVGFADSLRGWAGTLRGPLLWQTNDGGETWDEVTNIPDPQPAGICGISVVNSSVIYASGRYDGPAIVIKSTDGGATWTSMDLSAQAGSLVDCYFFSPDSGMVVGGGPAGVFPSVNAVVLTTFDGGSTWQTRYTSPRVGEWCWKIAFPTPDIGYVSIETLGMEETYVLKTGDRGMTWEEKLVGNGVLVQGIGFATPTLGWLGAFQRKLYQTADGGSSWQELGLGNTVINRFRMLSDTLGFAAGSSVYKFSRDPTSVTLAETERPSGYRLEQNFPNPFNPSTSIRFDLPRRTEVSLKIFDLLGREVTTLVAETLQPGEHNVVFTADGLPIGVYLYRFRAGEFMQTRKLTVLK